MSQFNLNREWIFEYDDLTVLQQENAPSAAKPGDVRGGPCAALPDVVGAEVARLDGVGQQADTARR